MKIIIPTVDHQFYLWQMLVQIQHFAERGELDEVTWVVGYSGVPTSRVQMLRKGTGADIRLVEDRRRQRSYAPSLKPWLMARLLEDEPLDRFHYLDPDVLLTQDRDYYEEIPSWSGSPTDNYTGPDYLRSHGEDLWEDLCEIAGADADPAAKVYGAGAQWVVGESDSQFWDEVAEASTLMAKRCQRQPKQPGQQYPVQSWCAEMYATQLTALAYGFPVRPDPTMQFLWANGPIDLWDEVGYFHNAGVPSPNGRDFCKSVYQTSPFGKSIVVSEESASYHYLELVRRTEQNWPKLLW